MKIAVIPASYDPPTKGHIDIITRASKLFDKVIVIVAINEDKRAFLPVHTRVHLLKKSCIDLANVSVEQTSGLITEFMRENGAKIIVRGVRSGTDLDYERNLEAIYKSQYPEAEVVVLTTRPEYSFISSSLVRSLYSMRGDFENLVPDCVYQHLSSPVTRKKIIYLCGNPGCGKTFYRQQNESKFEAQNITFVFDANDFKDYGLIDKGYTQADIQARANKLAFAEADKRIANAESMLCEVTVASMLLERTHDNIRKMRSLGYQIEIYLFEDNVEVSKKRNANRDYPTPEDKYVAMSDSTIAQILSYDLFDVVKFVGC